MAPQGSPSLPVAVGSSGVERATAIEPDAYAAGTVYTDPLDRRGYREALFLLESGDLGSSATVDCKVQEADKASQGGILNNLQASKDTALQLDYDTNDASEIAFRFTTPNNGGVTPTSVHVYVRRVGTIAASKYVTMTMQADGSTDPDDTDLFTPVNGHLECADISTDWVVLKFTVPAGVHLAANTDYWVVFEATYTASTSNHIEIAVDTVGSGGNAIEHDADWGSLVTTQTIVADVQGHDWADVANGAFTQLTEAGSDDNKTVVGRMDLKPRKAFLRTVLTVATATSDCGARTLLLDPIRRSEDAQTLDFDV